MIKFIKRYALEIYTVLGMAFMVVTSFMNNLSTTQLFVVVFNFLFIALFVCMQKALTMMVGMQYRELPKLMMKQIRKMRSR